MQIDQSVSNEAPCHQQQRNPLALPENGLALLSAPKPGRLAGVQLLPRLLLREFPEWNMYAWACRDHFAAIAAAFATNPIIATDTLTVVDRKDERCDGCKPPSKRIWLQKVKDIRSASIEVKGGAS